MSTELRASDSEQSSLHQPSDQYLQDLLRLLSEHDSETPRLMQRYVLKRESLDVLAQEIGITGEGLRKRFSTFCSTYTGSNDLYKRMIQIVEAGRLDDYVQDVKDAVKAGDKVALTGAGMLLSYQQWRTGRLIPNLADKREVKSDNTINVIIGDRAPQPVVVGQVSGEVVDVSVHKD